MVGNFVDALAVAATLQLREGEWTISVGSSDGVMWVSFRVERNEYRYGFKRSFRRPYSDEDATVAAGRAMLQVLAKLAEP